MKLNKLFLGAMAIFITAAALGFFVNKIFSRDQYVTVNPYENLGGDFTLLSAKGPVSLRDFRGKVVIMFFGFTSCSDVCPTGLSKIASVINLLQEDYHGKVAGIFITVDPGRDTPEITSKYASFFHDQIIGVSGSIEEIAEVARNYYILYQPVEIPDSNLGYTIDHTATSYVIDSEGEIRQRVQHNASIQEMFNIVESVILGTHNDS